MIEPQELEQFDLDEYRAEYLAVLSKTKLDDPDLVLKVANIFLDGFGVEHILPEEGYCLTEGREWSRLRNGAYASFINLGRTYAPTILYDYVREELIVSSWGGWCENNVEEETHEE